MADLPLTLEQAQKLRDMGQIDDQTYQMIAAKQPEAQAEVAPAPAAAEPAPQPTDYGLASRNAPQSTADLGWARQQDVRGETMPEPVQSRPVQPLTFDKFNASLGPEQPPATPVLASQLQQQEIPAQQNPMGGMYEEMMKPFDMQQAAVAQMLKTAELRGAEESALRNKVMKDDMQRLEQNERARMEMEKNVGDRMASLDQKMQEVGSMKVDPNNFWANKSTGEKVLAGIGLFLGSFGQNGNQAAKIIQNAIATDIDAQKANIDQKTRGIQQQKGLLSEFAATTKDSIAAKEATRIAYLNNAQQQIQALASKYQAPEQKAKAMELIGQLEGQKNQAKLVMMDQARKMYQAQQMGGNVNPESLDDKQRERYIPGYGLALTKEDASKMKEYLGDYETAKTGINKLKALGDRPFKTLDRETIGEADSTARMIQAALRTQILGPGTVNDSERQMLESIVANPTAIFSMDASNKKRLDTLLNSLGDKRNAVMKSYGLKTPESAIGFTSLKK